MLLEFLKVYYESRGQSLLKVGDRLGFGELVRLWMSGAAIPHLGLRDQEALKKDTGLPTTLFGFLQHFADSLKLTVPEAFLLGTACKQSVRRWHGMPNHTDYFSIVDEIRGSDSDKDNSDDVECEFCGRLFQGTRHCPHCGRVN